MEVNKKEIDVKINDAKLGSQTAFKFLLDLYWNDVYNFQLKRVQNEYEAEDITIESFSKAFDKINSFNNKFQFKTWLITISKNIQIDKSRMKNAAMHSQNSDASDEQIKRIPDDSPTPEDKLITKQNLTELLGFIKLLKPHYQEVINLRYFQELSYAEISEELSESLSNVKVRLLRAKKLLAEIISNSNNN